MYSYRLTVADRIRKVMSCFFQFSISYFEKRKQFEMIDKFRLSFSFFLIYLPYVKLHYERINSTRGFGVQCSILLKKKVMTTKAVVREIFYWHVPPFNTFLIELVYACWKQQIEGKSANIHIQKQKRSMNESRIM